MTEMTHRERVLAALNHEESDRVPIDFGGTYASTIYHTAYDLLKEHLGVKHKTEIYSKRRQLAIPDDIILRRFDIDTQFLGLGAYEGEPSEIDEDAFYDEWGTVWRRAEDGHYLYVDGPFYNQKKPGMDLLEQTNWPDPDNRGYFRGLRERAVKARKTDRAVVLNLAVGVVHRGQFMRGFGDWLKDLYKNRAFTERFMDIVVENWIRIAENALDQVGDNVDIIFFGDDLAAQQGPLFNPETYREIIKPRHKRMIDAIKAKADIKVLFHSCGAMSQYIGDLIDIGVDAINPVQITANDMDPATLKARLGGRITFWGGVNSQEILPFGTPDQVREEVRRMIDVLGPGGGFVLNSVHNLQKDVPMENIVAMFDEAREYGATR